MEYFRCGPTDREEEGEGRGRIEWRRGKNEKGLITTQWVYIGMLFAQNFIPPIVIVVTQRSGLEPSSNL